MIRAFERELNEADKRVLIKEIAETRSYFPKTKKSVLLKMILLLLFATFIYYFPNIWLIIPLLIISFFMAWMTILEVKELFSLPRFLKEKEDAIETGIARVREIKLDRYIKLKSYQDEGDHFILEHEGKLMMVGGQEFGGVRKLKNKIEHIDILHSSKRYGYNTRIVKHGQNIEPYLVFNGKLSDEFVNSDLWDKLTEFAPFRGKLEDLDTYLNNKVK